ncbi:MAG TPA: fasciclin domain-containing protein [Methanoregula sp.]|nr:fasciclin domain-containing protein [Methanoregula sp.]
MEKKSIFLILAVLITASVLFAGCATQSPPVTPTPVTTVTTEITAAPTTIETTVAPTTNVTTVAPTTIVTTAAPTTIVTTIAPTNQTGMKNIVETAEADGRFTTLVTALKAAQLDGNLSAPGSFTVFAPTDNAFKKLPDGTVNSLINDPNKFYLKKMLLYHVVNKKLMAADVMRLGSIDTLQGESILVSSSSGVIYLNGGAKIIATDIVCSNGVIHAIDTVLAP